MSQKVRLDVAGDWRRGQLAPHQEERKQMWVLTRSDWPALINLDRAAVLGYQQIAKFDSRTRVIAAAWEQEHVLAECADGNEARALMIHIAEALASGDHLLDLRAIDLARLGQEYGADRED